MLDAFWSGIGEQLAGRWIARILTPAFGFWAGGLFLVWYSVSGAGIAADGWIAELGRTTVTLQALPVVIQIGLLVGSLILVATSALIAERLTQPLLRLLEGYWFRPLTLRSAIIVHRAKKRSEVQSRRDATVLKQNHSVTEADQPTPRELVQLGRDRAYLRSTPELDEHRMPTRLGDLLRAAEVRPTERYGIDAVVCWPALWLLLPAETRTELTGARAALDGAVRAWLWGALFLVWTPWNYWALLVGIVVPLLSYYYGILSAASAFGELMVTSYDLNRMQLYAALHLERPRSARDERRNAGPRVTDQLSGLLDPDTRYAFPPSPAAG